MSGTRAGRERGAGVRLHPRRAPEKTTQEDRRAQAAGIVLIASIVWFLPWLIAHVDLSVAWLALPFVLATGIVVAALLVSVVNRWQSAMPVRVRVVRGSEPRVAVIVPTLGEPLELLERTIRSLLAQDWPAAALWVLVSDDGRDERVQALVNALALEHPRASLRYHQPPPPGDPRRRGDAKAGNLNSAIELLPADIEFVETRDADDVVGDRAFLRETVGQLAAHERLAFVQTIKTGAVAPSDPFDNHQPHFYRCAMLSRYAANAVFPCGSGVVWRLVALRHIGGFPTWNLVEDLQSGLEVLRRGWDSCYLPIVGAYAQHSPEDLPNFVKQRGTWAIDTVRLVLWAPKDGLDVRQRLQFYELALFYLQGPATLVFLFTPIFGFAFHSYPVVTSTGSFLLHFWPFAATLELYMAAIHRSLSLEQLWRARLVWAGLSFVYARAWLTALRGGRTGKPRYVVTRKQNVHAWHWRQTLPHTVVLALLAGSMGWSLAHRSVFGSFDVSSAYWVVLYGLLLAGFVPLGWHGVERPSLRRARTARTIEPVTQGPLLARGAAGTQGATVTQSAPATQNTPATARRAPGARIAGEPSATDGMLASSGGDGGERA